MLAQYHSLSGHEHDPLIMFEMAQIRHALKLEKEASQSTSYLTLFATPGNRKRMVIIIALALFSQWRYVCLHSTRSDFRLTRCRIQREWTGLVLHQSSAGRRRDR